MQVCLFVFVVCTVHVMNYGLFYMDGVTLVAQLSITILCWWRTMIPKCKWLWQKLQSHYQNCSISVFVANRLNWKLWQTMYAEAHTQTNKERERAKNYRHIFGRKFASIVFLTHFLGYLRLWQFSIANQNMPSKNDAGFWPAFFVCVEKLSNIFPTSIHYVKILISETASFD